MAIFSKSLGKIFHSGGLASAFKDPSEIAVPLTIKTAIPHTSIDGQSLGTVWVDEFDDPRVQVYLGDEYFGTYGFTREQLESLKRARNGTTWSHSVLVDLGHDNYVTYKSVTTEVVERRVRISMFDWEDDMRRAFFIQRYSIPPYFESHEDRDGLQMVVKWKVLRVKTEEEAALLFDSEFFEP